jgi:hypothetical protein
MIELKRMAVPLLSAVLIAIFFIVTYRCFVEFQNATYANKFFSGLVAYDKVLASRKWHFGVFGCSYAIVSLKYGANSSPPSSWLGNQAWSKTPIHLPGSTQADHPKDIALVCISKGLFSSDVATRLQKSINEPGSHYWLFEDTLSIYSEPQRIAAFLRYGD